MPIARVLREGAFAPDEVQAITAAYAQTCNLLLLTDRDDPLMDLVATKVLEIAQSGERDPNVVSLRVVKELLGRDLPD